MITTGVNVYAAPFISSRKNEREENEKKKSNEKTSDMMQKKKRIIEGPSLTSFLQRHDTISISLVLFD